jgi:hypothetical protein
MLAPGQSSMSLTDAPGRYTETKRHACTSPHKWALSVCKHVWPLYIQALHYNLGSAAAVYHFAVTFMLTPPLTLNSIGARSLPSRCLDPFQSKRSVAVCANVSPEYVRCQVRICCCSEPPGHHLHHGHHHVRQADLGSTVLNHQTTSDFWCMAGI